jgi:WD40 repeat protein
MPAAVTGLLLAAGSAQAGNISLIIQQGTDISVTAASDGRLVMGLAGRLWRLPPAGGSAVPITAPEEFARRAVFSPDGQSLAYQSLRDGVFQVVVTDAAGGNARQATRGTWHHLSPAWSPDGRRLAVASDRGGDFSIWELAIDSGALRQLSFEPGTELDPSWGPAGRSIAYVSEQAGRSSLVLRPANGPPRTLVTNGRLLRAPAWRPDGSVITYAASGPQGTRLNMVILSDPPVVKPVSGTEAAAPAPVSWLDRNHLVYTADGQIRQREFGARVSSVIPFQATLEVALAGDTPGRPLAAAGGTQTVRGLAGVAILPGGHIVASALGDLWEFTAAGALVRALTDDAYVDRDPAVSPDGRWLAFTSDRDGSPQIWSRDLGTGDLRQLTAEPGFAEHPAWDSRAKRIAYLAGTARGAAGLSLKLVTVDTRQATELTTGLVQPGTPAWTPGDARLGVIQHDAGSTRLLLYATDGAATPRRLTLPEAAVGPGVNEAQWAADGKSVLIASAAGIRALPVLANGLVGAQWRPVAAGPAQTARWIPGEDAVLFTDADGLARAAAGAAIQRIDLPLVWRPAPAAGRTIIRASRVFEGSQDQYLLDRDIVIEGNRIVAIEPRFATLAAAGDIVIDATGKTVMPGLIDLALQVSDVAGERVGRTLLAYGITTVHALATPGNGLQEIAERWQAHAAGPRLLPSPEWCGAGSLPVDDTAVMRTGAVRLCPAAIGDVAALAGPARAARATVWSASWLEAASGLVDAIAPPGILRPGPAHESLLEAGGLFQDAIDVMVRSGVLVVTDPAGGGLPALLEQQPDLLETPQYLALNSAGERQANARAWRATAERDGAWRRSWLRDRQRLLGRIAAGGGRLGAASAAPATPYGLGLHAELRLLAGAGLNRAQVLRLATVEAARALGLQNDIGSVATGRVADLLIIDGDPLTDLRQLLRIDTIIADGRVRPMAVLLTQPAPALEKFTPPREAAKRKETGRPR